VAFATLIGPVIGFPALFICMERLINGLNPASGTYFRVTREGQFGKADDAKVAESWQKLENGWATVRSFLDANGEGKNLTVLGEDKLTFADIVIASYLVWVKVSVGEDSEDWKRIAGWGNGFATKILAQVAKYAVVDE
jgi:glutathione S-transferase